MEKRPEIGNCVRLNTGEEGTLLCSKGMGLTPLDLFNDILIERNDLKNFLGPGNWRESDSIALRSVLPKLSRTESISEIVKYRLIPWENNLKVSNRI